MYVRMTRAHEYVAPDGLKRRIPRGWVGDLPDEVAQVVIAAGKGVDGNSTSPSPAPLSPAPVPPEADPAFEANDAKSAKRK